MKIALGPQTYIRQQGIMNEVGSHVKHLGNRACMIGGNTALALVSEKLAKSLIESGIIIEKQLWYGGECSWQNIQSLSHQVKSTNIDFLIAVGGGKAIDTVKAVAFEVGLPLVAIPTIAATCAAVTPLTVIYDEHGTFIDMTSRSQAPSIVFADTDMLLHAPEIFVKAGIGDTLAKWFESLAASKKQPYSMATLSAVKIAQGIYEMLLQHGVEAINSSKDKRHSEAFDIVIDAILFSGGSVSGYGGDECRTAAAHAIYSGLTIFPESHQTTHGEIVAFGILAQMMMEKYEEREIQELISYYVETGLPITLKQIGISSLETSDWERLGEVTVKIEDMDNMPFDVTPEMVIEAVQKADSIGTLFLEKRGVMEVQQ